MARYLVTGGCGFIGSHLCESLVRDGHFVRVLDDLSTGKRENRAAEAELLVGDVADVALVRQAMADVGGCFHLAAVASVERSNEDWVGTHRTNLTGTIAVLDAARGKGRPSVPVVYASSAAVYGDERILPLTETTSPKPLSAYGADKLGCELHAYVARLVHGVATAGLRLFNVFGPRQDPKSPYSGVIPIFCDRLLRRQKITIFGDGRQSRDFVYVTDVVKVLRAAMAGLPERGGIYNVCTGRSVSVLDLARHIGRLCAVDPDIEFAPARSGEIRHSVGSPARLKDVFGIECSTSIEGGLSMMLAHLAAGADRR